MKWYTHIISLLSVLVALNKFSPLPLLSYMYGALGSIAPDLVEKALFLDHRNKWVHNLLTGLVLFFTLPMLDPALFALGLGYVHHLLLDITRSGIYAGRRRIEGPLNSTDPFHNVFVIVLHLLLVFSFFKVKF